MNVYIVKKHFQQNQTLIGIMQPQKSVTIQKKIYLNAIFVKKK